MVLNFTAADEIPGSTVLRKIKTWKVGPGVRPETFTFLRVRGTKYLVGLPAATAKAVLAEKDAEKVKRTIAALTATEAAAARSGLPSPGKMLLLVQSGDAMSQVTTAETPAAQKTGAVDWSALAQMAAVGVAAPAAAAGLHVLGDRVGRGLQEIAVGPELRRMAATQRLHRLTYADGAQTVKKAMGLSGLAGAAGGVNAGARHGAASAGVGGLVGSFVGEYVLPMVEQALLAAGPEFAQVAKPAALLASGIAGEISGRLVGNILQPKLQEIQERNHERA